MYDAIVIGARCAGSPTAMLLARKGYRVLLVDRATFPSDTISTQIIWPMGVARVKSWGLLDKLVASNCPPVTKFTMHLGDFPLSGWGPQAAGIVESYGPRRTVLDKILVDAAVDAGVELREGFAVDQILMSGGQVTGVQGRQTGGLSVTEEARIVIGADGKHSVLARSVQALEYDSTPSLSCFYYTYWSGVSVDGYEDYWPGRHFILTVPTNDNLVLIVLAWPRDQFHTIRADIEKHYMDAIDLVPELAERVRAGRQEERFYGSADLPNFFRKPFGPGWALVGDAGYSKDPITAFGISDAFRDAELLSEAIDNGFAGQRPLDDALAGYEHQRNEAAKPLYETTLTAAAYDQHHPRSLELRAALRGNQADTNVYLGVLTGSVPKEEFFNSPNIRRILAEAQDRNPSE
ncbi:MAG: NAD(P)/FAD-dependent oxidoreductase [Chloroflexi bacterium]|nr:NAD(P)/FAD-dependent oxidoreductase [Chloroflexota bacterium]